jgi:hypothetical protein
MLRRLRGRGAAAAIVLAVSASLLPTASVLAVFLNPATGGSAISADEFGTNNFTTLSGPAIAEQAAGFLALNTTTVLSVPAGFQFNAGAGNVGFSGAGCDLAGTLTVTQFQATFKVTTQSTVTTCVLTFVGLQVQPTAGPGLTSGDITKSGSSAAPGGLTNYGTLTKVAGAVTELIYLVQPSANNFGGTPFGTQPVVRARDQFGNNVANAPVALAITPGTGATGATLACTPNPVMTNAGGNATFVGCVIDLSGSYRVRASNGSVFIDSGTFNVGVGPASKIIFKAYPASTTPPTLNPQPRVAVTDAGGNTVTGFPPSGISLAINKSSGTFTCTGGLSATTVNGEAQFAGCTQTTPDTGYTLTANINVFNIVGPAFAVTPPTLAFIAGPGAPTVGQPFPTNVQVAIQNGGATIPGIAATVTLAIGTNPSGGVLTCTGGTAVGTVSGVATFTGCAIDKVGTGYTLTATASNVIPAQNIGPGTSAAFNVTLSTTPAVISLTSFCGTPQPIDTVGPNQCAPDTSKSPAQANIKLPQTTSEGVWLQAHFASNGANRSVIFEVSKDQTTWSTISTQTTTAAGNAQFFYRPSDNRFYRVSFAGAGDLGPGMSPTLRVVVRALVFITPSNCPSSSSPCKISQGRTITFHAIARPNRPELPTQTAVFTVQRKSGSSFVTVSTQSAIVDKATGFATLNVTFNSTGQYRIRVNLQPTPVNANSFPTDWQYYSVS